MKDTKTLLLLFVSLLLLLASITLLWSWGYQFSFNRQENNIPGTITSKDSAKKATLISDSLQRAYYKTLNHLDKTIDSVFNNSDSLKGNLDVKLSEFYQLRSQITDSFKNRAGDAGIKSANEKINQLQQRVAQLRISNTDVENENKRLTDLLKQYSNQKPAVSAQFINTSVQATENKSATVKNTSFADFTASDLQLVALAEESGKEETSQPDKTLKLAGSFMIKNKSGQSNSIEIMIVVLQPNGKVLQKSTWESGAFQTNTGNKIYSCKIQATCNSGEAKRLQFWLGSDYYQKGNYSMQVYHKGVMIAKITKAIS